MADYIWNSSDGNFGAAGSYSPSSGPPAINDSITFDATSQYDVSSGLSALTGVDLERIWVTEDYEGNIGADGNPLVVGVHNLIHNGQGSLFINSESHASNSHFVVDSPNEQDALFIADTAGTLTLHLIRGGTTIADGVGSLTYVYVGGGGKTGNHLPTVDIGSGNSIGQYIQKSGYVTSKSMVNGLSTIIDGGTFIYDAASTANSVPPIIITGGNFVYNGTGTMSYMVVGSGGTLDMSQDSRAKAIGILVLLRGSNFVDNYNTTITTLTDLRGPVPVLP